MDNCGILFHHFCSGFVRVSGKFWGETCVWQMGWWWQSLRTWTAASCRGVSPSLSPAVRSTAFSDRFQPVWMLMCPFNNSKIATRVSIFTPLNTACLFHFPYHFIGDSQVCLGLFCRNYDILLIFHFLSVLGFLTPKCFFLMGRER